MLWTTLNQYCVFYSHYLSLHCTIWHMLTSACTPVTTSSQTLSLSANIAGTLYFVSFFFLHSGDIKSPTLTLSVTANRIGSESAHLSTISRLTLPHTFPASKLFALFGCCSLLWEFISMEEQSEREWDGESISMVKNCTQLQQHSYKLAHSIEAHR